MMSRTLRTSGTLALACVLAVLTLGCQDDGEGISGPSAVTRDTEVSTFQTTTASASRSGPGGGSGGDDPSDDPSDDDSTDDDSSDDSSTDDEPGDDLSEDADDEVKGLFFGVEACPTTPPDCLVALRIKDTLVIVTGETEIVHQPAGDALVDPATLAALVADHVGLPMKAEGSASDGGIVATKLRLLDEIRATGDVLAGNGICDFGLSVRGQELCFALDAGVTPPTPASTVRVEGRVPSDFFQPFLATKIQPAED